MTLNLYSTGNTVVISSLPEFFRSVNVPPGPFCREWPSPQADGQCLPVSRLLEWQWAFPALSSTVQVKSLIASSAVALPEVFSSSLLSPSEAHQLAALDEEDDDEDDLDDDDDDLEEDDEQDLDDEDLDEDDDDLELDDEYDDEEDEEDEEDGDGE